MAGFSPEGWLLPADILPQRDEFLGYLFGLLHNFISEALYILRYQVECIKVYLLLSCKTEIFVESNCNQHTLNY